jgi:predicted methyltransferase
MRIANILAAGLAAASLSAAISVAALAQTPSAVVVAAVADAGRPDVDKARDVGRKPAQLVALAGVKAGDKVGEFSPGGGFYTRILAKVVGDKGKVYTINRTVSPGMAAMTATYPNVTPTAATYIDFKSPEPLDVVWTTENYHDFKNGNDMGAVNKAVFEALKPGGIYLITDHNAPGAGFTVTRTLHRIDVESVKAEVLAAGFTLDTQSSLLANPADPHTVSSSDMHDDTDRFVLKFRKPR